MSRKILKKFRRLIVQSFLCLVLVSGFYASASGQEDVVLIREWTYGLDENDPPLGVVADCLRGREGETYILDMQVSVVYTVSDKGVTKNSFGQMGEGPGDLAKPRALGMLPNADLVVSQTSPKRLSIFRSNGVFKGEIAVEEIPGFTNVVVDLGVVSNSLVLLQARAKFHTDQMIQQSVLVVQPVEGGAKRELFNVQRKLIFADPVIQETLMDPLVWAYSDRQVILNHSWSTSVESYDGKGEGLWVHDFPSVDSPRTTGEIEYARSRIEASGGQGADIRVSKVKRPVRWLGVTKNEAVFVLLETGAARADSESLGVFQYRAQGQSNWKEVRLMGRGDPFRDRFIISGDRLYVLLNYIDAFETWAGRPVIKSVHGDSKGEDMSTEPMAVICYRIPSIGKKD